MTIVVMDSSFESLEEVEREYPNISESEKLILLLLSASKPKKVYELSRETSLSIRSIRYSLKKLLNRDLIISIPDFSDLRSNFYQRKI